ncbi:hypothetical protein [Dokdonella immobilis]|uniref:Uncharacterized protein n=1 Tax=Dokdonella immobilis TaxID=578942 RepID=A0A1I4ZW34_9GAMM|nr:hypothetical protein [Dokdonella immobilis]SFN54293.1 hypothetical protein SAMN05216289_12945 [Dokdonella immobilis]
MADHGEHRKDLRQVPGPIRRGCCAARWLATWLMLTMPLISFASPVTTLRLHSTQSGLHVFTAGLGFRKGDVPDFAHLQLADSQVTVKARWNDGSVKHAIAAGQISLVAGQNTEVVVESVATEPGGTALTASDIQNANPSALVDLGAVGAVSLSTLLATPVRTWISGPEMVEAHYRASPNGNANIAIWFQVRLYKSGQLWVRTWVDNGRLDVAASDRSYVPSVVIGGVQVFDNGGAVLTHFAHTRWSQEAWIGAASPVEADIDTGYLVSTRLLPNFFGDTPGQAALDGLTQVYVPFSPAGWTPQMGETGFQDQIGLLPLWDALYVTSHADSRARKAVMAQTLALNSYPIVWKDSVTQATPLPSARPTWTVDGPNQGGATSIGAGALVWDIAHHGSGGYLAYLISGDYYALETMADQAALCYLMNTSGNGSGTARLMTGQTRGMAWCLRTLSQYVGIAPSGDPIAADYRALLASNIAHWAGVVDTLGASGIGYFYEYDIDLYAPGTIAPWQQHFMMQALGLGSDLEPLANMSAYERVRDWLYQGAVGILGTGAGYCFNYASVYNAKISDGGNDNPASWYPTWAQVFAETHGSAACGNALLGNSGGAPSAAATGYWGNLLPAIAYAVDHQASGAAAAWQRLTGASNWPVLRNSGFGAIPNWGIEPRATATGDLIFADSFENP